MKISASRIAAIGAATTGAFLVSTAPSFAQTPTYTFAQYLQQDSSQAFSLTNNGPTTTLTSTSQVFFKFQPNASYPQTIGLPNNFFDATMTFTAVKPIAPATGTNTPNANISETFSTYSVSFINNVTGQNLLTSTGHNLILSGKYNEGSSTLQVSTPPQGDVTFTSDYVSFATSTQRNFSISLSSVVPVLVIDTTNPNPAANGYIRSFAAASSGTFASNFNNVAPVPEPGMMTFALSGGAGLAGLVLRGRRRISRAKSA